MQKELIELAEMFKNRDNPKANSDYLGKVISIAPLKISTAPEMFWEKDELILTETYSRKMKQGDEVILIPLPSGQQFIVIDKAVRL
ncbi:MAG: DUF2577 family protein [Lysinibacillus sp.]